jgi:nucleotide-binding universal stress UspA family protein
MKSVIKQILVPTDGSEQAVCGVRYAAAIARQYDATLHGVHVIDIKLLEGPVLRDVAASLGTAPYANYQGNMTLILEERGKSALEDFTRICEKEGVDCSTEQATGLVSREIVERTGLADLAVMGRGGEHSQWLEGLVGSTTQAVVRGAACPVLVTESSAPGKGRYVVAYDGSDHAKEALRLAANVSKQWGAALSVLRVGQGEDDAHTTEAQAYLEAHDLKVDYVHRQGDPSEVIVEYARESQADLLIMGAYGHTKVRELVVGSTTSYAMNHSPCPLLLTR